MARMIRTLFAPALALVVFASAAKADYNYTLGAVTTTATVGISALNGTIGDAMSANPAVLALSYTNASVGTNVPFSFLETFTGTTPGLGTETFRINGNLTVVATPTSGVFFATFIPTTVDVVSGSGYSVPALFVNYLQTSNSTGNIGLSVTPFAVPEPASVAMLGLGLVGSLGFVARRRLARA